MHKDPRDIPDVDVIALEMSLEDQNRAIMQGAMVRFRDFDKFTGAMGTGE